ncbi:MAG: hypothetical protein E5X86_26535 [Mesorhizobium sp.]|uniref:hypothetical protein n=1 Tax=Mesorhizobium sp. TaxID=1871066 RepID=UPI00121C6EB0|nr:hypothetical protein [Mesorhizobium sp.]TIO14011.1 MAG: hypothetical protein E5X86_26535 [Mesorhizobium sp.]TIP22911.1 MAG: hypothetical protein E5X67_35485 [Mesorhizobium sp.]TIQ18943.1 MAG: hypothetical protein E5X51_23780 [Mesorhizobium sp.]TJV33902.1 MAG: hypothetical protein E5X87_11360 [Mesorhizobium sp.]
MSALTYIYRWDRHGRKGQPCAVTGRSKPGAASFALPGFGSPKPARFNSIRVEFGDGFAMVTSGNAIRKATL